MLHVGLEIHVQVSGKRSLLIQRLIALTSALIDHRALCPTFQLVLLVLFGGGAWLDVQAGHMIQIKQALSTHGTVILGCMIRLVLPRCTLFWLVRSIHVLE